MPPTGLFLYDLGIKEITAIIIDTGDQIPFLLHVRRPAMIRRIMLNQLPCLMG
jgi:hypothetical protein